MNAFRSPDGFRYRLALIKDHIAQWRTRRALALIVARHDHTSGLLAHARRELNYFKPCNPRDWNGNDDTLALLAVLASQVRYGDSAPDTILLFSALARFENIRPLTGEDDEWHEVTDAGDGVTHRNLRNFAVFKNDKRAFWIEGRIFRRPDGSTFINHDSKVTITFPWLMPKPEIVNVEQTNKEAKQ